LVKDAHFAAAYAVDAVAFTVSLWAAFRLPSLPPLTGAGGAPEAGAAEGVRSGRRTAGWREIRAGLSYIMSTPVLWLSFAIDIAAMVFALPRALFPQMADERFGPGSLGLLYAAIAFGSMLAGLTSGWISRVRR